jgi:hypothetical protein
MKRYLTLLIYILLWTHMNSPGQIIDHAEYFIDTDPGIGNGIPLSFTADDVLNFTAEIDFDGMDEGFHFIYIRFRNENGIWSIAQGRCFFVINLPSEPIPELTQAEYFLNEDPGAGNGFPITFTPGTNVSFLQEISLPLLKIGFHHLHIRFKDENGKWGIAQGRSFLIYVPEQQGPAPDLIAVEYFFDNDPGYSNGTEVLIEPQAEFNEIMEFPVTSLLGGLHSIGIRFKNENNIWSNTHSGQFFITECQTPLPEFSFENSCVNTPVIFTDESENVEEGAFYEWDIFNDGTVESNTAGSITYVFDTPGTYEVILYITNPGGCNNSVLHTIEIYPLPETPEITLDGSPDICEGSSVTLSVPDNYNTYLWSTGEESYQINVSEAGNYFVTVTNEHQCESISDAVTIAVHPAYSETDFASICEGASYTFGSQTLTQAGEYTEVFSSVWGCDSTVVLTLTVYPTYNETESAFICNGESYIFGSQTLTESGEYTEVFNSINGCDSTVVLTLTVHPTYSETDFASICNGDTYTFGSQTLTQPGVYTETFSSVWGCDSVVEFTLEVIIVDVSVTQDGITLTANAQNAEYQWLDCNNNFEPIPGATQQSFTPGQDGSYAVGIYYMGCVGMSECFEVTGVWITDYDADNDLKVYPNPARGYVRVEITQNAEIEIINMAGKSIFRNLLPAGSNIISLSNMPQGVYIIQSISRKGIITKKLVILDP